MTRSSNNDYRPHLAKLMTYVDRANPPYPRETVFTPERLRQLTPEKILEWMNILVYLVPNPAADANPIVRNNTVKVWKKAISSFMPDPNQWNENSRSGNPTKSKLINDLLHRIQKQETRRQGAPPQKRRPLEFGEFCQLQQLLRESPSSGDITRYGLPALFNFQSHLISRIDCACQWQKDLFKAHRQYPEFAARARLSWGKNVHSEDEAPYQIVLGSLDPVFCVFVSLSIWLEYILSATSGHSPYVFALNVDFNVPAGGVKAKEFAGKTLRNLFGGSDFIAGRDGLIGTHSIRKFAATRARLGGATKDDRDHRGRWKTNKCVSDTYEDTELPYVDGKVAAMLCPGGPCSYRIKSGSPVTEAWILHHVVPSISNSTYEPELKSILGKALLWVIYSEHSTWVPGGIAARVKEAYNDLLGEETNVNPIEKKKLFIYGQDASLVIHESDNLQDQRQGQQQGEEEQQQQQQFPLQVGGHLDSQTAVQLLLTVVNQLGSLQGSLQDGLADVRQEMAAMNAVNTTQFGIVNTNVRRVAAQPTRRLHQAAAQQNNNNHNDGGGGGGVANPLVQAAKLSPTPRNIYVLWEEWLNGIGGRKAARLFSSQERGRVKYKFCRRKVVWDLIARLVRAGCTAQVACDRKVAVYGQSTTVTNIIARLRDDIKAKRLHPTLTV